MLEDDGLIARIIGEGLASQVQIDLAADTYDRTMIEACTQCNFYFRFIFFSPNTLSTLVSDPKRVWLDKTHGF